MATEHSRNDGSKAQYYVVILDRLQDRSGGLERAPESRIRGPLTGVMYQGRQLIYLPIRYKVYSTVMSTEVDI